MHIMHVLYVCITVWWLRFIFHVTILCIAKIADFCERTKPIIKQLSPTYWDVVCVLMQNSIPVWCFTIADLDTLYCVNITFRTLLFWDLSKCRKTKNMSVFHIWLCPFPQLVRFLICSFDKQPILYIACYQYGFPQYLVGRPRSAWNSMLRAPSQSVRFFLSAKPFCSGLWCGLVLNAVFF